MRIAAAALLTLLPLLASCSTGTPADSPSASAVTTPAPDLTSAPTTPPTGAALTFEQSADFGDGLAVQVDNVVSTTAPVGVTGAEGTAGRVVLADVVITNGTGAPYDATRVVIQGYYRGNVGAVMLTDPSGAIGLGFGEAVPRGEKHKAQVGFAVPAADAGDITIVVDPRDGSHEPVRFQGAAVGD